MALPAAAAQADSTWNGTSASPEWGVPTNWTDVAPNTPPASNTAVGTLTFPTLGGCATCYTSHNGLTNVSAAGLAFTNKTGGYRILGNGLSVGSGGIADNPGGTSTQINAPLTLTANQTWAIGGGFGAAYDSLSIIGAVTGSPSTVAVPFLPGGGGSSGDLFVTSDMEVGPVTVTGNGGLHIGGSAGGGSVNGTNGNAVALSNGAKLTVNPSSKVGDLTIGTNSRLLLGTGSNNVVAVTLAAKGGVALGSSLSTQTYISNNGSTPGTDYSQVTATGPVTLGGKLTLAQGSLSTTSTTCATLTRGDVATLITTTGSLSGTFANAANGAVIPMAAVTGSCPSPPQVQINYTPNSVTATVMSGTTPTTTMLATPNPSPATTNQPVTLTATVSTTSGTVAGGTVEFSSGGTPISGCASQSVTGSGTAGTATCTTSFPAAGSPESLAAAFTGTTASGQASSISGPQSLTVNKASTATALTASNKNPAVGGSVTYTATVTTGVGGPTQPSGAVQFRDGGTAIAGCGGRPLTPGASASTATCTVTYPSAGSHSIIAGYGGDPSFTSSSSPVASVSVQSSASPPPPPGVSATTSRATHVRTSQATLNGSITTGGLSISWKFEYGRSIAYGHSTPVQTIAGAQGTVAVSSVLKRLSPHARYHYRLVVNAAGQTVNGRDVTFRTRATGSVRFSAGRLFVFGRTILVSEKCQSKVLCSGRFSLTTKVRVGKKKKLATVVCAKGGFRIKAHRTATARVRLSGACLRLLRLHHRMTVTYTSQTRTGQKGLRRRITLVLR